MEKWLSCLMIFLAGYFLNIFYITVLYHRGLTHKAVRLKPFTLRILIATGSWVTGLDPKAWACMHRLHHQHSDTPKDPHSPVHNGVFKLMIRQLRSYTRVLVGLTKGREPYLSTVQDLNFPVHWLNRKRIWALPYFLHGMIAGGLGFLFHSVPIAFAYWLGIMSHPIQGWMVNALAHSYGYTTFKTNDRSKNNTIVAWLVMGEGYQNNHHHLPHSAKFSYQWWEFDMGYVLCLIAKKMGLIEIPHLDESS